MEIHEIHYSPVMQMPDDSSLQQVAFAMSRQEERCVVITRHEDTFSPRPVGIVTERDLVILVLNHASDLSVMIADTLLNDRLITIHEKDAIHDAVRLMSLHGIHKLPVISDDGGVQGVLTVDNLLHHIVRPNHSRPLQSIQKTM